MNQKNNITDDWKDDDEMKCQCNSSDEVTHIKSSDLRFLINEQDVAGGRAGE